MFAQSGTEWRVAEAEIGRDTVTVSRFATVDSPETYGANGKRVPMEDAQPVLVVGSDRFVFREVDLPRTGAEEMRDMMVVRAETELPYNGQDACWCSHVIGSSANPGSVRMGLLALPSEEVDAAESGLLDAVRGPVSVECREAALAELAAALRPDSETAALVALGDDGATLVMTCKGMMAYARSVIRSSPAARGPQDPSGVARELRQSIQHYAACNGGAYPDDVLVWREGNEAALPATFELELGLPTERIERPDWLLIEDGATALGQTWNEYAVCVGAWEAARRRRSGGGSAACPMRIPVQPPSVKPVVVRGILGAGVLVLLLAVLWMTHTVRSTRLRAAREAVSKARPGLAFVDELDEEVQVLQYENGRYRSTLDLLLALVDAMPNGTVLREVGIDAKGNVTISGKVQSVEAAAKAAVALVESGLFEDARPDRCAQEKEGLMFKISCSVNPNPTVEP